MEKIIECTFCDGEAKLQHEKKDISYRKEDFCINQYYYKCEKCGEEFTTDKVDENALLQVHNQYRTKHTIPFVYEIIETREKYGLSAARMNEILGMGANSYSNFEKGDIPSSAIATLLTLADNPSIFKEMASSKKELFNARAFDELIAKIDRLIIKEGESRLVRIDYESKPSSLNGFRVASMERIASILCYFLSTCKRDFNDKLKLNKMLFYTDFIGYQNNGQSLSGLSYRAIQHGPAPSFYDALFTYLQAGKYIDAEWEESPNRGAVQIFVPSTASDLELFSDSEKEIIWFIQTKFKDTPSWDLRNKSHDALGWLECHPNKEIIDYQKYAYSLAL